MIRSYKIHLCRVVAANLCLLNLHLSASAQAVTEDKVPSEARSYELTEKGGRFSTTTTVTIFPRTDGSFDINAYSLNNHEKEWTGVGSLGQNGWIHFPWRDNFLRKGEGDIHILDKGAKVDFYPFGKMGASPWILSWTGEPVLANTRTWPSGYLIHLPGTYRYKDLKSTIDISVDLKPRKQQKVNISINISQGDDDRGGIMLEGSGVWRKGDILAFTGKGIDRSDQARGQLHFLDPNTIVLTITSFRTDRARARSIVKRSNTARFCLGRDSENDKYYQLDRSEDTEALTKPNVHSE